MKRFAVGYEFVCRIIMMVFVVHVAFIVHTLMGLVVAGVFPSVAACYDTYRTWLLDVGDRSWGVKQTWTVFHRAWMDELSGANVFGWPMFVIWVLLVWDYYLVGWNNMGLMGSALLGALLVLNVFYGLFMMVAWAVRSNFEEKPMWVVRMSLQMVIVRPVQPHGCRVVLHHGLGVLPVARSDDGVRRGCANFRCHDGHLLLW